MWDVDVDVTTRGQLVTVGAAGQGNNPSLPDHRQDTTPRVTGAAQSARLKIPTKRKSGDSIGIRNITD